MSYGRPPPADGPSSAKHQGTPPDQPVLIERRSGTRACAASGTGRPRTVLGSWRGPTGLRPRARDPPRPGPVPRECLSTSQTGLLPGGAAARRRLVVRKFKDTDIQTKAP